MGGPPPAPQVAGNVVFVVAHWKSTLIASWVAQVCSIAGFALVAPFLPFYVRELGVTNERDVILWSGYLYSSAGLAMFITAPIWGILADRYGRKLMVMRSMYGGLVVLGLMAYVTNVHQLLVLRIIQGTLTGTVSASVALVSSVVPTRRAGFALGLMQTALMIGGAIGPFVGGPLAEHLGYRVPFLFAAGFLLIGALLTTFVVREDFDPTEMESDGNGPGTIWQVFALTGFSTLVLLLFMVQFSGSFLMPILPLYIEQISGVVRGQEAGITSYVIGMSAVAAALSAVILGRIGDRLGYGKILFLGTLFTGLMLIPHAFARNVHELLLWRVLAAFVSAGTIPAANAMIRNLIPRHACGKAFGLTASITSVGWGFGPTVGSWLAAEFGMRQPFYIVGVLFVLISGWVLIMIPRLHRRVAEQQALDEACDAAEVNALSDEYGAGIGRT